MVRFVLLTGFQADLGRGMFLTSARVLQDENYHISYESWRRFGLVLISRAQCGPEAAVLGRTSNSSEETSVSLQEFLLYAAWGKCRLYL